MIDSDTAYRLQARFRAAVKEVAIAAGAPYRVNRLNWWLSKLARGNRLTSIQDLMDRSAEFCEELEARGVELGQASRKPDGEERLYRDRYPSDWGETCFLYQGPHDPFSDPNAELEYWEAQIWNGFRETISGPEEHGQLKRYHEETRKAYRDRVKRRVENRYSSMTRWVQGLSYDLAVLQANYIIDRGLRGMVAVRTFQDETEALVESVKAFWRESSKRLGLSYIKQERRGVDLVRPFREVGADLGCLISAISAISEPDALEDARNTLDSDTHSARVFTQATTSTPSEERHDLTTEAQTIEALAAYTRLWQCSEAALARASRVDPSDLSKWKKGLLPVQSDKKARIEKALKNNEAPTAPAKRSRDS